MTFVQITDTHFVPGDDLLYGMRPRDRLATGLEVINGREDEASFMLVTGDLAHHGELGAYQSLRDTLAVSRLPYHLMTGNHDDRGLLRQVFPDLPESDGGYLQFALEDGGTRILCLDSRHDEVDNHAGQLCDRRLAWLADEIARTPSDATLIVACHHPPFDVGIPHMDEIRMHDDAALLEVLAPRKPDLMLFGHLHRPISGTWHGIPFHIQRAFNHQVAMIWERTEHLMFTDEDPDFALIRPTGAGLQVFTHVAVDGFRLFPSMRG